MLGCYHELHHSRGSFVDHRCNSRYPDIPGNREVKKESVMDNPITECWRIKSRYYLVVTSSGEWIVWKQITKEEHDKCILVGLPNGRDDQAEYPD